MTSRNQGLEKDPHQCLIPGNYPGFPTYIFEEFVSGSSNDRAYTAARCFSEETSTENLLIILGDVGMGKTHLAAAIANQLLMEIPTFAVCYFTGAEFRTSVRDFQRINQVPFLMQSISVADLLILDGFQNLAEDEEVVDKFSDLCQLMILANKKIVITADENLSMFPSLSWLMSLRPFNSSAVTIKPPGHETRQATLFRCNLDSGKVILEEVIDHLALMTNLSLKALIDYFTSLVKFSVMSDRQLTVPDVVEMGYWD